MGTEKKDRLAAVRVKFRASLRDKAVELEKALSVEQPLTLEDIQALVHKIAGSTGFYGESLIAEYSAKIDRQLSDVSGVVPVHLSQQLEQLIVMLREA